MTRSLLAKGLIFALLPGLYGCSKSYLVLLEDHDGSTGKVIFNTGTAETELDKAGLGTTLDNSKSVFKVEEQQIKADFEKALSSEPVIPELYLLYFETGGTQLTAESAAMIPKIIETVAKHPAADISVIGHTDTVGDAAKNEKLAHERALQVSKLFDPATLDVKEITVTSHGEKNLLVKTADETPEIRNRRVEVTIR